MRKLIQRLKCELRCDRYFFIIMVPAVIVTIPLIERINAL